MDDDDSLWTRVTDKIKPIDRTHLRMVEGDVRPAKTRKKAGDRVQARAQTPVTAAPLSPQKREVDAGTLRRIKSGKIPVEAVLDLHGLTHDAAKARVEQFIPAAKAKGQRLILVITGKGSGVLRSGLTVWLDSPALQSLVLKALPAPKNKGGDGATLIYLRR